MEVALDQSVRPVAKVSLVLILTTTVVTVMAASSDFVETLLAGTRQFEAWEFDELILAAGVGSAAALVMAVAQIVTLKRMVISESTREQRNSSESNSLRPAADRLGGPGRSREEIVHAVLQLRRSTAVAVDTPVPELNDPMLIHARERILTIEALDWVLGATPSEGSPLVAIEET